MGDKNLIESFLENSKRDIKYLRNKSRGFGDIHEKLTRMITNDLDWYTSDFEARVDIYRRIWLSYKINKTALDKLEQTGLDTKWLKLLAKIKQNHSLGMGDFNRLLQPLNLPEEILKSIYPHCRVGWHTLDVDTTKYAEKYSAELPFEPVEIFENWEERTPDDLKARQSITVTDAQIRELVVNFCRESDLAKQLPESLRTMLATTFSGNMNEIDTEYREAVRKGAVGYGMLKALKIHPLIVFMLKQDMKFYEAYHTRLGYLEKREQVAVLTHLLDELKKKVDPADFVVDLQSLYRMHQAGIPEAIFDKLVDLIKQEGEISFANRFQLETFLSGQIEEPHYSKFRKEIFAAVEQRSSFPAKKDIIHPETYWQYVQLARELQKQIRKAEKTVRISKSLLNLNIANWYKLFLIHRALYMTKLENKLLTVLKAVIIKRGKLPYDFKIDHHFRRFARTFRTGEADLIETAVVPSWQRIKKRFNHPLLISEVVEQLAEKRSKTLIDILNTYNIRYPYAPVRDRETLELLIEFIRSFEKCYQVTEPMYSDLTDIESTVRSVGIMIERGFEKTENAKPLEEQYLHRLGIGYDAKQKKYYYL